LLDMLVLCSDPSNVLFLAIRLFLRRRPRFDATAAAVVADANSVALNDCGVVGVVDDRYVHAIDGGIVDFFLLSLAGYGSQLSTARCRSNCYQLLSFVTQTGH